MDAKKSVTSGACHIQVPNANYGANLVVQGWTGIAAPASAAPLPARLCQVVAGARHPGELATALQDELGAASIR